MTARSILALLLAATATVPAFAADPPALGTRVDRIERELRAVQRKVFPSGAPAFSEPEIAPPPAASAPVGTPAGQPLAELTERVSGLERELARLTGQIEQGEHRLTLLSQQAAQDRQSFEARIAALEAATASASAAVPPPAPAAAGAAVRADPSSPFRTPPTRPSRVAVAPAPAEAAPAAPASDPETAYMAGYRLWADKKYAEAEAALAQVAEQYPRHRRASYARNLLGRAYLDDGQPAEAARALYDNYKKDPRGERAPESLFYLGDALTRLKKYDDACKAYGELNAVYGGTLNETLRAKLPTARKAARCGDDSAAAEDAPAPARKAATTAAKKGK